MFPLREIYGFPAQRYPKNTELVRTIGDVSDGRRAGKVRRYILLTGGRYMVRA